MKAIFCIIVLLLAALSCGAKGNTNTIQSAAWVGDLARVKQYLVTNAGYLSSKEAALTLTAAADGGQPEMVAFLLTQGADVNEKGFENMTPLASVSSAFRLADDQKASEVAAVLLGHGAAVDSVDDYHETPLLHAVEAKKIRLVRVLLAHGANAAETFGGTHSRLTPLQYAIRHGDTEMASTILDFKPPLENVDTDGDTALSWAVKHRKLELAQALLEHGANAAPGFTRESAGMTAALYQFVNQANFGRTPLHWAVLNGDTNMVALLLKYKAPLDRPDQNGATPLWIAKGSEQTNIVMLLLQAAPASVQGAPPDVPTHEEMRATAQRIADGDAAAFGELAAISNNLYHGIDYQKDRARLMLNYNRMMTAFSVLGEQAARGNDTAFQALKRALTVRSLSSFAPNALGLAAAAGHQESLEILLHYEQWGIFPTAADEALVAPAKANVQPAVDYFASVLLNPENANRGRYGFARDALQGAAAKGNQKAKDTLDKFAAAPANNP